MTDPASARAQQRAIPPAIVTWLYQFGTTEYSDGIRKLFFDKTARKRLARELGLPVVKRLGDLLNAYIVLGDEDRVVTVGHRIERIKRH